MVGSTTLMRCKEAQRKIEEEKRRRKEKIDEEKRRRKEEEDKRVKKIMKDAEQ